MVASDSLGLSGNRQGLIDFDHAIQSEPASAGLLASGPGFSRGYAADNDRFPQPALAGFQARGLKPRTQAGLSRLFVLARDAMHGLKPVPNGEPAEAG
jgi:hypothetical protein